MSTIAEIEAAIEKLTADEMRQLKEWINGRLGPDGEVVSPPRAAWLQKLARLRCRIDTGSKKTSSETILEDLRAERG